MGGLLAFKGERSNQMDPASSARGKSVQHESAFALAARSEPFVLVRKGSLSLGGIATLRQTPCREINAILKL